KMTAAQSGRALELLMGPLIELADQLRTTYGTEGVQRLLQMVVRVGAESQLIGPDGKPYPTLTDGAVTLKWPAWFAPTPQDLSQIATTLRIHTDAGHMSQAAAVGIVAPLYDIPDAQAELLAIESDEAKRAAAAPQVIEKINV
ncbi:Phage portal protein, partial [mine drainage metagenome]